MRTLTCCAVRSHAPCAVTVVSSHCCAVRSHSCLISLLRRAQSQLSHLIVAPCAVTVVSSHCCAVRSHSCLISLLRRAQSQLSHLIAVVRKPPPSYFCQLCNKKFNGPQPYSAHMVSRAHREEEQLANEN